MSDLSVLIPARQEQWLRRTVEDVLENRRGNTDVIVVLDGEWPEPGYELEQHPDVHVVKLPAPIGQRAATNLAARFSDARYVMKLDAHCALAEGFDVALMDGAQRLGVDTIHVPAQKHLHVFDMVCTGCGQRFDQSPVRTSCTSCQGTAFSREVVWKPRASPTSSTWRFDADLHFQYWHGARATQKGQTLPEVMSCLGACWFLDRSWFLETLGGLDEDHGSWGQMGTEIACKAWLSGGRMVCNKATWFAHFFRVGGHKFPYEMHAEDQKYAQAYSQNLWRGNHWPGQVKPLRALIDKFWPVPGWTEEQRDALPRRLGTDRVADPGRVVPATRHQAEPSGRRGVTETDNSAGIVYYSHGKGDPAILDACRDQLATAARGNLIVSVTLTPTAHKRNIVLNAEPGYLTMFRQILAGLEALETDYAFLAEHDVLYDASHFAFRPPRDDVYYYNLNWWKVDAKTGRAVTYEAKQTSQLCGNRQLLIAHYRERIRRVEAEGFSRAMGFEPGSHRRKERVDDVRADVWRSPVPNIDIRHEKNLTPSRWSPERFRDPRNCQGWTESDSVPGWGKTLGCFECFLRKVGQREEAYA